VPFSHAESLREAVATIRGRPLRALLAALAMAAAVATTAVVQTALDGLARAARETSARAFGADSFVIARYATGTSSRRELALKMERNPELTRADGRFLEKFAAGRVRYAATAQRPADVNAGGRTFENATIGGTEAALFDIRVIPLSRGRYFTPSEVAGAAQVAVAGRAVTDALYPAGDPLGATLRIGNRAFRIVGTLELQGTSGSVSLDRYVWIPLPAFERAFGATPGLQIFASADARTDSAAAEDHARTSMRARRHLGPGSEDTFDIITPEAARSFVNSITERIGAAGPPISLMALLAAIVVVTNTTLVSVTQRTREIGIRRAVGAGRANILFETLAESSLIAVAGGVAGVVVAVAAISAASGSVGIPLEIEWRTIAWSLAAAGLSGVVAGWYPARRAARVNVITALRLE
jgi:putative ABC transport system permease protein